jgi:hypothetical protein
VLALTHERDDVGHRLRIHEIVPLIVSSSAERILSGSEYSYFTEFTESNITGGSQDFQPVRRRQFDELRKGYRERISTDVHVRDFLKQPLNYAHKVRLRCERLLGWGS